MDKKLLVAIALFSTAAAIAASYFLSKPTPIPAPPKFPEVQIQADKSNLIKVASPKPNDVISSPLLITGEARGTWYFEASFPAVLLDANGTVIASGPVQAQSDWMTESFVPFKMSLQFSAPATDTGTLVLKKDNPSGEPERDDALRVPVRFK